MKKGIKVLALVLSLVMVLGLFAGCNQQPAETQPIATDPAPTEPPKAVEFNVLWNVNYTSHYINSTRAETDGYYKVSVGTKGGQVNNRVAKDQIDKLNGMQFFVIGEKNADGIITKIQSIGEAGGSTYAGRVMKVEGTKVTLGTAENGVEEIDASKVKIYQAWSTTARYVGVETKEILPGDNLTVVLDNLGNINSVWMTARTGYSVTVKDCPCAVCVANRADDKTDNDTTSFKLWTTQDTLPTAAGHYFLGCNITVRAQASIAANAKIVLDLKGYKVQMGDAGRMWSMHNTGCTLDVMDTSEAKTGTMSAYNSMINAQGSVIWIRYGTLTLHGGTFDGNTGVNKNVGACIAMEANTTLNIKNGVKIIGGTVISNITDAGAVSGGYGGALYATTGCVINMEGGEIIGGKALSSHSKKEDGRGVGGAIYLNNTAVLNMTGGKITKGEADNGGPCIAVKSTATINNNGGTIEDIYNIPA